MKLIVSEKNIAAERIAGILAVGKPTKDKVYTTPVYKFRRDGDDWVSIGLKGHIMKVDFPEEHAGVILGSPWRLEALPTLVTAPVLKLPAEKGIIQSLRSLAKKADEVIIATDFDREGELIGADARDVMLEVNPSVPVRRVRFSAITKQEVERAFAEPSVVSDDLAQAGETRQDIDLVWGATLTRLLTLANQIKTRKPFGDVLSAGRVQTPTLKLIVDREKEREAFAPEDYWVIKARFAHGGEEFGAGHSTERFGSAEAADAVISAVEDAKAGRVAEVKTTKRQVKPPVPFNTTSLMAVAASEGMTPAQTMRVAESLYIAGHISYPRVDNTVYPPSLDLAGILRTLKGVPQYSEYAGKLLARDRLVATRGEKETTDHPPIHPTGAPDPEKLEGQAWKIYNLVARRFMATLSDAAIIEGTRVDIDVNGERFVAKGDVVVSPGFRAVYQYGLKKDEHLPAVSEGDEPAFLGAESEGKQTQPPARYSAGRLIQEMERLGLGTKATRHDIIQNLYERKYVEDDPIEPTCKGRTVVEALEKHAGHITTPGMTQQLEREMDSIANARSTREAVVDHSRELLGGVIAALLPHAEDLGEQLKNASDEDAKLGKCPVSGHDLLIKYSPKNKSYFVGCSGYPECGRTYPLPPKSKYQAVDDACPECGTPQVRIIQFKRKPQVVCLDPECPTRFEEPVAIGKCPTGDDGDLIAIRSQSTLKRFARCTNYEQCKTSFPLPAQGEIQPTGETCEPCGAPVVIIQTRRGPWRICVNPDCPSREAGKKPSRGGASGASRSRAKAKPKAKRPRSTGSKGAGA